MGGAGGAVTAEAGHGGGGMPSTRGSIRDT